MKQIHLQTLSYNIHKGFDFYQRKFILRQIRESIQLIHADLVFLQEVQGEHLRHQRRISQWPQESQFEFLADRIWPHYAYGKNAISSEGHHGNALLSKYPISFWENIDISTGRLETRGMLHAQINLPNLSRPLHAICIHLGLFEGDRVKQIELLCQRIESHVPHHEPLIVAGDFNDWREQASSVLKQRCELREAFLDVYHSHARTFPCWMPVLRLDRIYYRGLALNSARVLSMPPWNTLSDHAALSADFQLMQPPKESRPL